MNTPIELIREIFFPNADRCPFCDKEGAGGVCQGCAQELNALRIECDQPSGRISAYYHDGLARKAVLNLKFNNKRYLSRAIAGELVCLVPEGAQLITCVPLHKSRLRRRGYNQSELIARELAKLCGIPYENLLLRTRATAEQARIEEQGERIKNVKGAFCAKEGVDVVGKSIVLIDDVITTGATSEECVQVLKRKGAQSVTAMSFTTPR